MYRRSKILLILIIVITSLSIGITFYKTVISHDFEVMNVEEEE